MHFGFSAAEAKWFGRWETRSGEPARLPAASATRGRGIVPRLLGLPALHQRLPACLPACPSPTSAPLPASPSHGWLAAEFSKETRKTYTFFLLADDVAAANSSGGPKTLMYRVK